MKRVLAAVAVVGVAALAVVLRQGGDEHHALPALIDTSPAAVRSVVVEADGRHAELTRIGGTWAAASGTPPQSAPLLVSDEGRLFPMLAYRVLTGDPADPQYGLAVPAAVVRLQHRDGRQMSVRLGAASFSGGGFYAGQDGEPGRVYLVPRQTVDLLRSLTTGERTSSADPLGDRAGQYEAERNEAGREKEVPVYLRQVLERGGQMPPPGP